MKKKEKLLGVRFSEQDSDQINRVISQLGLSAGEFIRFIILDSYFNGISDDFVLDSGYSANKGKLVTAKISYELVSKLKQLIQEEDQKVTTSRFIRSLIKYRIESYQSSGKIGGMNYD